MIRYLFLVLLLSACSPFGMFTDDSISPNQESYIRSAIVCDCKTSSYEILNQDGAWTDFFNGEGETLAVKYKYAKIKGMDFEREIKIIRGTDVDGKSYYTVSFDKFTFPGSQCSRLKSNRQYLQ